MEETFPRIDSQDTPDGRTARLGGRWSAADLAVPAQWQAASDALNALPPADTLGWDLEGVQRLDHVGAQLLWNHWSRQWPKRLALLPDQKSLLERVAGFSCEPGPTLPRTWAQRIDALGVWVLHGVAHGRILVRMVGQLAIDLVRLVRVPRDGPWRDISGHLYQMGTMALPITALVGFLIGVVLAYLTAQQLRQFGAESFIVNILGMSLIRELGPMLAAILIAGRSGSSITAAIGVMRVTEELDAMRVMGIAHGYRLVMPRAVALAIVMPLISVWTTLTALAGGMLAADLALGITPAFFLNALPEAVGVANLALAMFKSVVFGLLIALVACHYGLRVKPNTQSLGQGTTASVVTSITVVILVDALFAIVFKNVGT